MVVEMNTLLHCRLYGFPISLFKSLLGASSHLKKSAILSIKTLQYRLCYQQLYPHNLLPCRHTSAGPDKPGR
jgi:hypothetical protein